MIVGFRHKGLERLYADDDPRGVRADHVRKIRQVMDVAQTVEALDVVGFHLHPLTGDLKGRWAVTVRANWRIVFRFEDGRFTNVDLVDYH